MAGRNPFQSRILGKQLFIEHNFLVLTPQLSESTFEPFPNGLEGARNFADPVDVAVLCHRSRINSRYRRSRCKEILDYLWYEPPLPSLCRFADNRPEVQLPFRQTLQRRVGDLTESVSVHVTNDPCFDVWQIGSLRIHLT